MFEREKEREKKKLGVKRRWNVVDLFGIDSCEHICTHFAHFRNDGTTKNEIWNWRRNEQQEKLWTFQRQHKSQPHFCFFIWRWFFFRKIFEHTHATYHNQTNIKLTTVYSLICLVWASYENVIITEIWRWDDLYWNVFYFSVWMKLREMFWLFEKYLDKTFKLPLLIHQDSNNSNAWKPHAAYWKGETEKCVSFKCPKIRNTLFLSSGFKEFKHKIHFNEIVCVCSVLL